MKIAIVYDRINKIGGAERILSALHEMWPDAPFYTAVFDASNAPFAKTFDIRTSFMQFVPFAKVTHEWFPWLTPLAFESFDFSPYDAVISVTSAEAKSIITGPHVCHICYCLTPTRYLWSGSSQYERMGVPGMILRLMAPTLRRWDLIASTRPDFMVAISREVEKRISSYYHRTSDAVMYPPVDTAFFGKTPLEKSVKSPFPSGSYILSVGRLVKYKGFDRVIRACVKNSIPLVVIGRGREERALRALASPSVQFVTKSLTDGELRQYYHNCRGFVFPGREDFGIVAVEALSAGKGVLCPRKSGMAEVVREGVTGMLFDDRTHDVFEEALKRFFDTSYDRHVCRREARKFEKLKFMKDFRAFVESSVLSYNRRI